MLETTTPTITRLIQATAIVLATSTAGANAGLSLFTIPRILDLPSARTATEQWGNMFNTTKSLFPIPMVVVPTILNLVLARQLPTKARLYLTVAMATLSILPYTAMFMAPVNWKLERRLKQIKEHGDGCGPLIEEISSRNKRETAHDVIQLWGSKNLYRSSVSFLAGCAGLYAALV